MVTANVVPFARHGYAETRIKSGFTAKRFFQHGDTEDTEENKGIHGENFLQTLSFSSSVLSVSPWLMFFQEIQIFFE